MSLKKQFALLALALCAANFASADTLQLKGNDAVTGTILAEKSDSVVVDLGYTVLVVPRNVITKISRVAGTVSPAAGTSNLLTSVNPPQFYSADARPTPARDVQDTFYLQGTDGQLLRTHT